MERRLKSTDDVSVIHTAFIRRCISIAHQYGSDLSLGSYRSLQEPSESERSLHTVIGKHYTAPMPHLAFANRWHYIHFNEQGANIVKAHHIHHGESSIGEVRVHRLSRGQPTGTQVIYEFGGDRRVYAQTTIDNAEPPPPAALSFMIQIGVPIHKLGWDSPPPFTSERWDNPSPLDAMAVLAIMRVVNSQFT